MRSMRARKTALSACLILASLLLPGTVAAGEMDAALAAFDREDYEEAHRLIRPLAEDGNARAQFYLGSLYYAGDAVPQDHELEAEWIRRSADQGFAWAQNMLGRMHMTGVNGHLN